MRERRNTSKEGRVSRGLACGAFACLAPAAAAAAGPSPSGRPVHTFSIVAYDEATGQVGVAVESHYFSVGSVVTWAEPGVGAVATQSFVNPSFGPRGLALLAAGRSPQEALAELLADDADPAHRQVALVDVTGRVAAHTGDRCIASAGQQLGAGYSVQANMMLNERVVPAMASAFEASTGPLAERLLAALAAGQAAGGDIRGQQSAALLVVRAHSTGRVWEDRLVDLRVEDDEHPIDELRRLLNLHTAYRHMDAGDEAVSAGDMEGALREYSAASSLAPENLEMVFWTAFSLATNGRLDEAVPLFARVFAADAHWIELLRRLPAAGLGSDETVATILARTGAG